MLVTQKWIDYLKGHDVAFLAAIARTCRNLGIPDCRWLMAVMWFESKMKPACRNSIGATGLIQFLPSTARGLGTTTDALRAMTAAEQMRYVEAYLRPYRGRLDSLEDLYMAVLWPRGVGMGADFALWRKGSKAYAQNPMDWDGDGKITIEEATRRVREIYWDMCKERESV